MTDPDPSKAEIRDLPERTPSAPLRRLGFFIAVTFLLISTYVLSIGPVVKLIDSHTLPEEVSIIYAPLEVLSQKSPDAQRFFRWYLEDVWKT